MSQRVKQLQEAMSQHRLDCVLLPHAGDLEYLIKFRRERRHITDTNMPGDWLYMGIVWPEGGVQLVLPSMARHLFESQHERIEGVGDVHYLSEFDDFEAQAQKIFAPLRGRRVGVGERFWGRSAVKLLQYTDGTVELFDADAIIREQRMRKEDSEIAIMRQAGVITGRIMSDIISNLVPGLTEYDLVAEIERLAGVHGAEGSSFTTGITFKGRQQKSRESHHVRAGRVRLEKGMVIAFDFGVLVDGYCSDFGRTVFFGEPDEELKRIHHIIMASQAAGNEMLRPGILTSQVDQAARGVIEDAGYGPQFTHRLGHGIGVDVHEYPFLSRSYQVELEPNMTFTNEPSISLPRASIRVEDVVRVTAAGGEFLTDFTHDLLIVE